MESSLILNHDDSSSELPEESLDLEYDDFPLDLVGLPTFDYNSDAFHVDEEEEDDVWQPNKVQTPLRSSTSGYQSNRNSYLSSVSKTSQRDSVVSTSIREAYALDNDIVFYNNDVVRTIQDSIGLDTDSRTLLAPKIDNKDEYEITVITENRNRKGNFLCFTRIAKFFLKKYHPLQKDCSRFEKVKYQLRLPPTGKLSHFLYIILSLAIQWALTYVISPREAAPGGNIFAILVLITSSWVFSKVFRLLTLPGFLGMLTAGILIGNIPLLKNTVYDGIHKNVISIIRQMALVCLLLKTGQTFDVAMLRKLTYAVLRLAIFPAFSEITFVTVTSKFLLNFGWLRAILLGTILSLSSPSIILPTLFRVYKKCLNKRQQISSILIGSSNFDHLIIYVILSILLGITFSEQKKHALIILEGPCELLIGSLCGMIAGGVLAYLPHKTSKNLIIKRFILLFCGCLLCTIGCQHFSFFGAGLSSCFFLSFVCSFIWKTDNCKDHKITFMKLHEKCSSFILLTQLSLIGAEIRLDGLKKQIGLSTVVVAVGLIGRFLTALLSLVKSGINWKERIFISLAWLPKAVRHSILAIMLIDISDTKRFPAIESDVQKITSTCFLAVLFTSLLGPILCITAPFMLRKAPAGSKTETKQNVEEVIINRHTENELLTEKETVT